MAVLEVKEILYAYKNGKPVLLNVNAIFERGKMYAILGVSGSGKTTLLSLIGGLDVPQKGKILFEEENILQRGLEYHRRNRVSLIFQSYNLVDYMTPIENVELTAKQDVLPLLERLGLTTEEAKRNVMKLSGGQQQRVAIARALASDTPVILADEPTGNLDSKATKDVMNLLKTLNKEMDSTILMVTHDAYVASMCHRVLFIKDGRIYQEIVAGDHESEFYQRILDMLTFLGGDHGDVNANRL